MLFFLDTLCVLTVLNSHISSVIYLAKKVVSWCQKNYTRRICNLPSKHRRRPTLE